jgi:hypothetical protein
MSKQNSDQLDGATTEESVKSLKKALIAFAIVEALVLIPFMVYMILR